MKDLLQKRYDVLMLTGPVATCHQGWVHYDFKWTRAGTAHRVSVDQVLQGDLDGRVVLTPLSEITENGVYTVRGDGRDLWRCDESTLAVLDSALKWLRYGGAL